MILLVHMLFGAAIGASIKNIPLAIVLAFLGHYFLDLFPHIEYSIENIKSKIWKKSFPDFLKVFLDFCLGLLVIFMFFSLREIWHSQTKNLLIIYLCALIATIPDGLTLLSSIFPSRIMAKHDVFHTKKIHFLRYKKISNFWRITTQILAVVISIALLNLR